MYFNFALPGWVVATAMLGLTVLTIVLIFYLRRLFHGHRSGLASQGKYATNDRQKNLENRTKYEPLQVFRLGNTFFSYGLMLAAACCLLAFSWEQRSPVSDIHSVTADFAAIYLPPQTHRRLPPPPPPPPPPPLIETVEDIVENPPPPPTQSFDDRIENAPPPRMPVTAEPPPPLPPAPLPPTPDEDEPWVVVEYMPLFPGCDESAPYAERKICADQKLLEFVYNNVDYPAIAQETGTQGMAVVSFVVEKDGRITSIEIMRDPGARLGDEARRVVELMVSEDIRWSPGIQMGRPVPVQFNLPIRFELQ